MEDWIFDLNRWAKELLANASELEDELEKAGESSQLASEPLKKIKDLLGTMCVSLSGIEKILNEPAGPLERVIQKVDGAKVCADASTNLKRFLTSHERMLQNIGVPEKMVTALKSTLETQLKIGDTRLDEPQTLTKNDGRQFADQLGKLRQLICEIHQEAELFAEVWNPELPRACVQGILGACLIVVDITGALTAPDMTGFVLVKAVKSIGSGYNLVRNSAEKIQGLWSSLKQSVDSARTARQLRRNAPRVILRNDKHKDSSGDG